MTDNQHVSIAKHTDILELLTQELESRGVVFEKKICKLLYLAMNTRFFKKPVSIVIKTTYAVDLTELAKKLGLDKSPISKRIKKAVKEGYLANLESRTGRPAQIVLEKSLPEDNEIFPSPEKLFA